MPKKKPKMKDTKKTTAPETPQYELITLEENHAHQIKHEHLMQRVWNSTILIKDAEITVKENDKIKNITKEWETFIACDKIPNPFQPQKIRDFFEKCDHFEEDDVRKTTNWLLAVDERSILNQDIDSVNITRKFLKNDRVDFGEQYDARICDSIELSKRIEEFLENPYKDISDRILCDVKKLQSFVESKISHYIDSLTYRVLLSEAAYMEPIDVTTAEYSYQGQHFDIHLWTFQDVPLNLDPEEYITPTKSIELHQIKTELGMPFCVLCENMVIRGLHYQLDQFSPRARYSNMLSNNEFEPNLKACLQNEWESQRKIQADVKTNMMKERADFEEAMRLKAEEEEIKAKEKQKGDKVKKTAPKKKTIQTNSKKLPKEPPIITPDVVPLVRRDFLEHDTQKYTEAIIKYHPNKLGLSEGEVNLRQFQILGGVYQINSLVKPKAINYPGLLMTWYKANKSIEYQNIQSPPADFQSDDVSKFFEITFELSDNFCHWGEPVACIFEESPSTNDVDSNETTISTALNIRTPLIVNDFNLHGLFTKPMMYNFIEHSIPRIISSFKFPEDFHDQEEEKKSKSTLGRSKANEEDEKNAKELEIQKQFMSFDIQESPERLFPLFKKVYPIMILPVVKQNLKQGLHPYETFSEFISALELIKNSYRKSTFADNLGNQITILAEEYGRNIKEARITSKIVAYEHRKSFKKERRSFSSRQSLDQNTSSKKRLSNKADSEDLPKASKNKPHKMQKLEGPESVPEIRNDKDFVVLDEENKEEGKFSKWSTTNIIKAEFNPSNKKVTIWTDRLGTFGFAFNRYQHFPFKSWSLQPFEENPKDLELSLETEFALIKIYITRDGYKVFATDFTKSLKNRKIFLDLKKPIQGLKHLKEKLQQKFLNIFPEHDAIWYVNGQFSEKHLAAELHAYNCMSLNASFLNFQSSDWNKLSNRRTMVLKLGVIKGSDQDFCLIRITPEDVMFVDINEVKNYFGINELEYIPTWRNIEWYADLNQLISSNFSNGSEHFNVDQSMIVYLKNLLHAIRPLSFS